VRVSRRDLLLLIGGLSLARLGLGAEVAQAQVVPSPEHAIRPRAATSTLIDSGSPDAGPRTEVLGKSRGGQPLTLFQFGTGHKHVLILGGQHGAPEANTVVLTDALLDAFSDHHLDVPKGITVDILAVANPDGLLTDSRQFLSGVDPNRNWDEADWQTDAYDSLGRFFNGLGGPAPMSEPETRELAAWIAKRQPALVINYHSAGGLVSTRQPGIADDLSSLYADAGRYPYYGPDEEPFSYPITGAMDGWLAAHGIPDIFVELSTPYDAEYDDNAAGLTAVLGALASA
jgi:hypothetical protein